jgi:amino acid adenylation domain-containing protein
MNSLPINKELKATAVDFDPFADGDILLTAAATEAQKEIWASVRLGDDASCAYNESISLSLNGKLNLKALQNAFQALIERHESLRVTISPDGNNLCINTSANLEILPINLFDLGREAQKAKIIEFKQQAVTQPFDLEHGSLFRVQLLALSSDEHCLILTAHHIICDGWSWGIIVTELGKLYSAFTDNLEPDLDEADLFSEYALEREANSNSPETAEIEAYWLQQFSGEIPVLDLPTDRPRPSLRTFDANREDYDLSENLANELKQLGTSIGCSFMTVLIASFEVLLHRLTEQNDIVVGVPAAGQAAAGKYNLVGHCVNLLPLRTQVEGNLSFIDYLKSRSPQILDAYDRQPFTFGSLLSKLTLPRDSSRIPLVTVIFNIDRGLEGDALAYQGLEVECTTNPRLYENFELYVNATEFKNKVTLEWQYNTNLFDAATIRRRILEFETLLQGIVDNPDTVIDRLPVLSEAEVQSLASWNQIKVDYPQELCIHQLIEARVEKTPNAIAAIESDRSLSYRELNRRANQLAHHLNGLGVGGDSLVGIYLDRSLDMLVGLLAILKAGGAYIPLDPTYPQERIAFMLADSGASILLSQQHLSTQLAEFNVKSICLDTDWEIIAQNSSENPLNPVTPQNLAYVIYTSGSTGKPKGVALNHRPLVNLLTWQIKISTLQPTAKTLQFTPISFDVSFQEIFSTWGEGGTLVMIDDETRKDAIELLQVLEKQEIARLFLPFVALQNLAEVADSQGAICPALREVITAGEQLQITPAIANWFSRQPNCTLHNHYGPSESHVVTAYTLTGLPQTWQKLPPIGRPIDNSPIYILNNALQLVPIGVAGELFIVIEDSGRGYIDRPELTAAKFIANPIPPQSPLTKGRDRLYKTGDLARYLPDGNIEYLGRIDGQVKVRGFRIELGEVEAALSQCPGVREVAVIVREDLPSDKRLVAYLVVNREISSNELRTWLKQKLPEYMIPTVFVILDSLPLTPSGKVDRRFLPIPDASRRDLETSYAAPQTAIERQIVDIWTEILKLEKIGIHDNFFDLGGYSLLGTQFLTRLRQLFSIELSLRVLFELPTVAELANRVENLQWITQGIQNSPASPTTDNYEEGEI